MLKQFFERWKTEYDFKTFITASGEFMVTVIFALYNGYLGIRHGSLWHGAICAYYLILVLLRGMIIAAGKKISQREEQDSARNKVYLTAAVLLLILNSSLVLPMSMMVRQQTPVSMTMVPSIALATYTTFRVILVSVNFRKRKTAANCLSKLLRTISFIDALVSIIVLQNTLIMVNTGGGDLKMLPLTAVSSAGVWFAVLLLSIGAIIKGVKQVKATE